ncbi:hypothetical protein SAMN05421796_104160 [Chryseobacterium piscicola]|uniref:YhhN-like protein n=1 Tax=Chryseobacterium piscicola TaxID=551459 RepID=A0A1N7MCH3_9FLAO|nr:hypothetical protein [Chryseobacterium piscicola]PQA98107.1 hypothetical protein B0A70_00545 [Chryseobacterium piscicola]SIS83689.1 hypothetical protein SAMN05421796_104160 [Chryseobacterium piscicola]
MSTFYTIFLNINYILLFINSVLGFGKFGYFAKKEKMYIFYIFFLFLIEMTVFVLTTGYEFKDLSFMYPIYIAGEFFLLTSLFIGKLNVNRLFIALPALLATAFWIVVFGLKIKFNHDIAKVISNIIIICLAAIFLIMQIKKVKKVERFVLVDAGIFFYYSVSILIFVIQSQLKNLSLESVYLITGINCFFAAVLYSLITYTFVKLKK